MSHEKKDSLHGDIEKLLSQSSTLLKHEQSSRSLSRADSGGNSVVSATFKRPSSSSLASPSLRARLPEAETLQLDRPSSSRERSRLSFGGEPRVLTLNPGSSFHRDLPQGEPRTPSGQGGSSSPLLGGRPTDERRSSSPGAVRRWHSSMDGASSPTLMQRSASISPSPLNPAHTSLSSSLKAGSQPSGGLENRRTTTFGTPLVSEPQGSRILSAQSTGRSLSPMQLGVSKSTPSTRPATSAGPASPRPSSAGLPSYRSTGTGLGGLQSHARQPEVAEWQATVKELSKTLDAQGRTAKQDMEKRIAELNGRVANWDGLINKVAEDFDKNMDLALQEIYSRAKLKLHPSLRPPALDLRSTGANSDRRSLIDEPSFDSHSLAPSLSGNRTSHSLAVMPTPDPLPLPNSTRSPRAPSPRAHAHPSLQPQAQHLQQQQPQLQRQHSPFAQLHGDAHNPAGSSHLHGPPQAQAFGGPQSRSGPTLQGPAPSRGDRSDPSQS